ncbi:MAG: DUF4344 domain-containing metallopeptidase [Marmoricola sp.]
MRTLGTLAAPAALVAAVALAGCGSASSPDSKPKAHDTAASTTSAEPEHRIAVTYEEPQPTKDTGYVGDIATQEGTTPEAFTESILKDGGIDGVAEGFSDNFAFPADLTIAVRSGDGSPYYDPSTKTVNLFYSFAALTADIIKANTPKISDSELGKEWAAVNDFVLVHELGHAFVDVFAIPITGREEDSVDGLATFFFTNEVEHGDEYAYDAANFFEELQGFQGAPDATQFADEHSLSIQRAVDIACKVAGSSDQDMQIIASTGLVPDARLARCPSEYQQNFRAWSTLLAPHFRPGHGPSASASPTAASS